MGKGMKLEVNDEELQVTNHRVVPLASAYLLAGGTSVVHSCRHTHPIRKGNTLMRNLGSRLLASLLLFGTMAGAQERQRRVYTNDDIVTPGSPQIAPLSITIDQVMSHQDMVATGASSLTPTQRRALDSWLNAYTMHVLRVASEADHPPAIPQQRSSVFPPAQPCSPAIETQMSGEFEGWDGETIFRLDNGQIWEQSSYNYTYHYAYRPEVIIYSSGGGCKMKVDGVSDTISVRLIR